MTTTGKAPDTPAGAASSAGRRRWWGLVAISLGVSLIIVDSTVVNVAVPSIIDDLHITSSGAQWVQETYTLVFASFLLLAGRTGDRVGRRRVFLTGTAVFVAASVAAATAPSGPVLIGSRLVQGLGGAMILPTSLSLINATFRGRERGQAFAVWGSTIGGTAALGPLLGGWLTTHLSWRWAFGINLPLGALVAAGVLLLVADSRDDRAERGLDLPGAVLSVVGFTGIVFGLIEGRTYGWWHLEQPFSAFGTRLDSGPSPVPVAFALGLVALAAFVAVERHRNRRHLTALGGLLPVHAAVRPAADRRRGHRDGGHLPSAPHPLRRDPRGQGPGARAPALRRQALRRLPAAPVPQRQLSTSLCGEPPPAIPVRGASRSDVATRRTAAVGTDRPCAGFYRTGAS
ncbi:MFS transporter [Kitasatospora sp. NPDC059088]|uniref:MFS transporter n=1 Tax=Kitasatospora sp. NPDC059088 TaxID=3346722 RepID=UPI00368A7B52